jgi:NAD(P)-dependent dehydrogenase (short-subunit alcohol dehydrogenase family)
MRFKDKVVLVTGAVRNTGLAIADAFAREGAVLALNGRKPEDVERVAKSLRENYGVKVVEVTADISCPDQVEAMFAKIESECGRLDVLVNNAIIQGVGHSLVDTPLSMLEEVFRINVFGTYHCSQCAARMMLKKGSGAIVNIGSNTAERAILKRTAYVASKGAINSLTRAMALELGPQGIRVNCVVAGYIHSDRWASLTTEAVRRRANIPLGKEADGCDIAEAVLFLASENASKINGAGLVVDGGISVQLVPPDCDC